MPKYYDANARRLKISDYVDTYKGPGIVTGLSEYVSPQRPGRAQILLKNGKRTRLSLMYVNKISLEYYIAI